jgi:hypothetical protein
MKTGTMKAWRIAAALALLAAPAGAEVVQIELDVAGYLCGL